MINILGKTLVMLNMGLAGVFLATGIGIYTHRVDWGWKEPREDLGERVPSEIDKRMAAVNQAAAARGRLEAQLAGAQGKLKVTQEQWFTDHLTVVKDLDRVFASKKQKEVVANLIVKGGRPALGAPVQLKYKDGNQVKTADVNKSLLAYYADLRELDKKLAALHDELIKETAKQEKVTLELVGELDANNKVIKPGLYYLLQTEEKRKQLVEQEIETVRPTWVRKLVDAQLLLERRARLQRRLAELKILLAAQGK